MRHADSPAPKPPGGTPTGADEDCDAAPDAPLDQAALLAALRARVARLEGGGRAPHAAGSIPVCEGLPLPGGGLARAALHEMLATAPGCGAAFCALLLARTGGTVLWIAAGAEDLLAWPPGLVRLGLSPERLVLARAAHWPDALWAMEEALRCSAVTGALLVLGWDTALARSTARLDLAVTRRLQLAAAAGGALGLLLRPDTAEGCSPAAPSAAATRWRLSPLITTDAAPDAPRWRLELLRVRGGAPGGPWAVTWRSAEERLVLDGEEVASAAVGDRRRAR